MKTDDRPEGEQWQMLDWMREVLHKVVWIEFGEPDDVVEIAMNCDPGMRTAREHSIATVIETLESLHNAGRLLTREQKRDIDAIKRALPSIAEYEKANITSVICRLTSEENVILRQRLDEQNKNITRLKAENEQLESELRKRCYPEHLRDLLRRAVSTEDVSSGSEWHREVTEALEANREWHREDARRSAEPEAESDRLCEKITELAENGTCPGCMATDEAEHKKGCPIFQIAQDISRSGDVPCLDCAYIKGMTNGYNALDAKHTALLDAVRGRCDEIIKSGIAKHGAGVSVALAIIDTLNEHSEQEVDHDSYLLDAVRGLRDEATKNSIERYLPGCVPTERQKAIGDCARRVHTYYAEALTRIINQPSTSADIRHTRHETEEK